MYSKKKSDERISARASKKVCIETGLHLGKILEELSKNYGGNGGGHDGAAGFNHSKDIETILDDFIIKIKQILNQYDSFIQEEKGD